MIGDVGGFITGDSAYTALERRLEEVRQARRIRLLEDAPAYGLKAGDEKAKPEPTGDHQADHDAQELWRSMVTQLVLHHRVAEVVK